MEYLNPVPVWGPSLRELGGRPNRGRQYDDEVYAPIVFATLSLRRFLFVDKREGAEEGKEWMWIHFIVHARASVHRGMLVCGRRSSWVPGPGEQGREWGKAGRDAGQEKWATQRRGAEGEAVAAGQRGGEECGAIAAQEHPRSVRRPAEEGRGSQEVETIGRAAGDHSTAFKWRYLLRRLTWLVARCRADVVWQRAHVGVRTINDAINDQCDRTATAARRQVKVATMIEVKGNLAEWYLPPPPRP